MPIIVDKKLKSFLQDLREKYQQVRDVKLIWPDDPHDLLNHFYVASIFFDNFTELVNYYYADPKKDRLIELSFFANMLAYLRLAIKERELLSTDSPLYDIKVYVGADSTTHFPHWYLFSKLFVALDPKVQQAALEVLLALAEMRRVSLGAHDRTTILNDFMKMRVEAKGVHAFMKELVMTLIERRIRSRPKLSFMALEIDGKEGPSSATAVVFSGARSAKPAAAVAGVSSEEDQSL